jgi:hypothetical protein
VQNSEAEIDSAETIVTDKEQQGIEAHKNIATEA